MVNEFNDLIKHIRNRDKFCPWCNDWIELSPITTINDCNQFYCVVCFHYISFTETLFRIENIIDRLVEQITNI